MASVKQKGRTQRERGATLAQPVAPDFSSEPQPMKELVEAPDVGSRLALTAWLCAFLLLLTFLLWDTVKGLLF